MIDNFLLPVATRHLEKQIDSETDDQASLRLKTSQDDPRGYLMTNIHLSSPAGQQAKIPSSNGRRENLKAGKLKIFPAIFFCLGLFSLFFPCEGRGEIKYSVKVLQGLRSGAVPETINRGGEAIGFYFWNTEPLRHSFIYRAGSMHDLGTLPGFGNFVIGLNNHGQSVGYFSQGVNDVVNIQRAYFHDTDETVTDLGSLDNALINEALGINDLGIIVGLSGNTGFVYQNHQMRPVSRGETRVWAAVGINNHNQILAWYYGEGNRTAIFGLDGEFIDIGTLHGAFSSDMYGFSINDRGEVVGQGLASDALVHGFLYSKDQLQDFGPVRRPSAINNSGIMVGNDLSTNSLVTVPMFPA
jgi:probable HAF family extracellular repeat protein